MALNLGAMLANGLLCESTCRRRKMDQDTLCDRVEAWRDNPKKARRCAAIEELSDDIAQLRDVLMPDTCWQPGLEKTLTNQLFAIQSAIDMLKTRSCKDANKFGAILEDVRSWYSKPRNWPWGYSDEHMDMMLKVLEYAIEKSSRAIDHTFLFDESKPCYGRVAEALDQAFWYQERGLTHLTKQTSDLFRVFRMVCDDARMLLCGEMIQQRDDSKRKFAYCMSTLGEPPQCPSKITSCPARTWTQTPGSDVNEEDGDPRALNESDEKKAAAPEICACRTVIRKMWQTDEKVKEKDACLQGETRRSS
ncbi:hypothetical protein PG991_005720 [Apiospora marii]|uniref:Uncharacterized protein n=1 Tax=Apiospora marii TaxID=335849 RepID=A0ABR1SBW4_9PEZI